MTEVEFEEIYGRRMAQAFLGEWDELRKHAEETGGGVPGGAPATTSEGMPPGPSLQISGPPGGAQPVGPAPTTVQQPKPGSPTNQQYQQSYKSPVGTATYKKTW